MKFQDNDAVLLAVVDTMDRVSTKRNRFTFLDE